MKNCKMKENQLINNLSYDNLDLEGVRKLYMQLEKEEIIKQYTLPKKAGKDGYYRVNISAPTKKNGRTTISAKSIEDLKDKIYQFEKGIIGTARKTFCDVFEIVQKEKTKYIKDKEKLMSVQNTIGRNYSEYRRFFSDTEFERKYIDDITKKDIENVVYMNLSRYDLRKKGLASMKSILRSVFALAFEEYWVTDNVYLRVSFQKYDGMLIKEIPIENRCHSDNDLKRIIEYLHAYQEKKPKYLPAYALEMQIIMGLRRGEIPPLCWSDIKNSYICISKEQITVKKHGENKKERFVVVHHTKTYKDRRFPITDDLDDFLTRLKNAHAKYYSGNQYLFPADNENGIITNNTVYNFYRRMCKNLGIEISRELIKGTHSFRRNAITDVVNATGGNIIMASQLFGNSPEVAKRNYYTGADLKDAMQVLNQRKFSF